MNSHNNTFISRNKTVRWKIFLIQLTHLSHLTDPYQQQLYCWTPYLDEQEIALLSKQSRQSCRQKMPSSVMSITADL